jgi:hypothetical protein
MIIGVTIPIRSDGRKKMIVASQSTCQIVGHENDAATLSRLLSKTRMSADASAAKRNWSDKIERAGRRSAITPPSQLPRLIPASTTPMIAVHV